MAPCCPPPPPPVATLVRQFFFITFSTPLPFLFPFSLTFRHGSQLGIAQNPTGQMCQPLSDA